ncbi:MAG: T9SS type A sorting domain-containing protein [Bacteroidales bacterium]|nr:T9SS type A sorting domain-containing protein [Bacteroidales bacterium]
MNILILKNKIVFLLIMIITTGLGKVEAQTWFYFQDSPDEAFYDFSWLWVNAPSMLEVAGADEHRFPVENDVPAQQGVNSLRLTWSSNAGGNWQAIAAGLNWTANNVADADTLLFFLRSPVVFDIENLPAIFMEDANNQQTVKIAISEYAAAMPANEWKRITIPMAPFHASSGVNFEAIKTIGFAQLSADGQSHTLFVDDMRIFKGDGTSPPVAAPQGLAAKGYDSHAYLTWQPNTESNLNGYEIYLSTDNGTTFDKRANVEKTDTSYTDFVRALGTNLGLQYKITALNDANESSPFSEMVQTGTYDMDDEQLMEMVQEATFRYFWDFAHPASGMARERNTSGNIVTSGGSGFGIMALLVGIERQFITRHQGIARMKKILTFLENADRFHGVWPHWLDGNTGKVIPFSELDNGGDLVETAFLVQGLLAARQYFNQTNADEQSIAERITQLWETVEWDWYRRNDGNFLYWHWSPNHQWAINMQVRGPNEAAIVYLLAIASPTHGVPASLWHDGWASSTNYVNGDSFYGYKLWVGWDYGGPLFFAHYSYLGFDPRNKKDAYANYVLNNRNHTLINRAYCIANPKNFEGYSAVSWGLTASDDPWGYMVHEPVGTRDNGTITPSAALSSMPYTPDESMAALKHFYRTLGGKIWGNMGFADAFNPEADWYATSYLAIDQGPIIIMIENHRSQLLWNNFMANPEMQPALDAIGFVYDPQSILEPGAGTIALSVSPVPATDYLTIGFMLDKPQQVIVEMHSLTGQQVLVPNTAGKLSQGKQSLQIDVRGIPSGVYLLHLKTENGFGVEKAVVK